MIIIGTEPVWDKEYATSFKSEMQFLKERGISYSFVKTNDYGITVWKYKKTVELFNALSAFYESVYYK